jgi:hypothetical protein
MVFSGVKHSSYRSSLLRSVSQLLAWLVKLFLHNLVKCSQSRFSCTPLLGSGGVGGEGCPFLLSATEQTVKLCRTWGSHRGGYNEFYLLGYDGSACHLPPEDGGNMLLRNVDWLSTDYTAFYLRTKNCSNSGTRQCERFQSPPALAIPVGASSFWEMSLIIFRL